MTVQTRLVLATLCVFNGVILVALGAGAVVFVDGAARFVVGAGLWLGGGALLASARRLRRPVEWR